MVAYLYVSAPIYRITDNKGSLHSLRENITLWSQILEAAIWAKDIITCPGFVLRYRINVIETGSIFVHR